MTTIRLPANNWTPRPYQNNLWNAYESGYKRLLEVAHRRWGKDEVALNICATSAFEKVATYWHMLPEYQQARKAIWDAVNPNTGLRRIDEAFPRELRANTNEQQMFIRFINGSTWQVIGSDNFKSVVGSPPYGIIFSEWSKANPGAWAYLAPILEENGGWAIFITTPEGKNHAYSMYKLAKSNPKWFAEIQTVEDTGFPMERVHEARKEYRALYGLEAGDALIAQEYYCSFEAAILGAVYGKQMHRAEQDKRISPLVQHDPDYPVYTAWDLGYDDATAIWFYQIGHNEILLIDYYECFGYDIKHYCEVLYGREIVVDEINKETKQITGWHFGNDLPEHAHRKAYNYHDMHYVPHDAGNKVMAAGGRSIVEQAREYGVKMAVIPATSHTNSEQALRKTLERCWFNETRCDKGIEALKSYHYEYNEDLKIFRPEPVHDWSSHASDAAEIMARTWQDKVVTQKERTQQAIRNEFFRKRNEYNIDPKDPYRIKPRLSS